MDLNVTILPRFSSESMIGAYGCCNPRSGFIFIGINSEKDLTPNFQVKGVLKDKSNQNIDFYSFVRMILLHESLHILLFHFESQEACLTLDNLVTSNLDSIEEFGY